MNSKNGKIIVLGASTDPGRYSYKAQEKLMGIGVDVIPVTPKYEEVQGVKTVSSLSDIQESIEGITFYVNQKISDSMEGKILDLPLKYVIFNPGTENPSLSKKLTDKGVKVIEACTLVLISTNQFFDVIRE